MSDEIRFTGAKGKEIKFEVDEKVKNNLKKKDKKAFKPLFDAIENFDGKKGISSEEFKMLKDLQTIFAKTGVNTCGTGHILDDGDAAIAKEFETSGMNIRDFIDKKLAKITNAETQPAKTESAQEVTKETPAQETTTQNQTTTSQEAPPAQTTPEQNKPEQAKAPVAKKTVITPAARQSSFNRAMQNAAKKYDKNTLDFTQEVEIQSGDSLTKIAKRSLQSEGNAEPTAKDINTRIAQIIAANPQIKDIDKLRVGTKIKVGTGQGGLGNDSSVRDRGTGTVPVKKSDSVYATDATKLIELIGKNGEKYEAAVKDKPELEKELADVHTYLINKFNNDEYLTLDEQKIFKALNSVNKLKENLEKAKYPNKIKELAIPTESTPIAKYPDLTGYQKEGTTVKVGEGEDATEITVSKYTKEGQEDVYAVQYTGPFDGKQYRITASSQEAVLKLKADLEALALQKPADGKNLTAEEKRANLEKLIKIVELRPTEYTFKLVIDTIKNDTLIDKNDPEAKALVQKLLLTRNGDVISAMVKDSDGETDNTLFENDPVALKTMAAIYKEIQAKEKVGEKLTPDEIKLKEALDNGVNCFYKDLNGKEFYYNVAGLYRGGTWANNPELSQDFDSEMEAAGDDANKKQQVISKFLKDPRTLEDPYFKCYLAAIQFENASPADQKTIVEMSDAMALARIDLSKLSGDDKQKEAVKEAFITRAKALFDYSKPADGTKPDPSNARYLNYILDKIDKLNEEDDKGNDPDKAVIAEILNNFFVTTGEGEEQTVKIKDFRRFTYGEMLGLANAVGKYGSDAQKAALANMITIDEMEDGQFVRAIENADCYTAVRNKYESFVDKMETKEEVLALIDKMGAPNFHIPFDKIMEKFGDDPEIQVKLLQNADFANNSISTENRAKLAKSAMQVDAKGNITFDKTKLPQGVSVQNVINILPLDCTNGEFAKMAQAIFMKLDLSNKDIILLMNDHNFPFNDCMKNNVANFVNSNEVKSGSHNGNEFVAALSNTFPYKGNENLFETLYSNTQKGGKETLIRSRHASDSHVLVHKGDSIDKIVKEYLKKHLDKFPQLKASVEKDKEKWTNERIEEALDDYMRDFRDDILKDLGINDPTKIKAGDIIELDKIQWLKHQPNIFNYMFRY